MQTKLLFTLMGICLMLGISAQSPPGSSLSTIELKQNAAEQEAVQFFLRHHPNYTSAEYQEFIRSWREDYAKRTNNSPQQRINMPASPMASCTNVDFEQGDLSGWTSSTGYNPGYIASGCCPTPGGAQSVVSGPGVDPCGGFPVVNPGGNFSLMLGDANVGGVADRIEQTFQVTAANTNFTYAYAVVLQDPGHATADQPSFQIEMLDGSGLQIPCTFYQVSAGQGIPGFQNSPNCAGVIYKPWTTVSVDLSNYVGQSVTIRFTTYDCALGGHYGYAYIDGSCSAFKIHQVGTLCNNSPTTLCAPAGYATYTWNGPGVTNVSGQCLSVSSAGVYDVQLTSVTGCSSPLINYTVNMNPAPNANFSPNNNNGCNAFLTFANTTSNAAGPYISFWTFGDGDTSTIDSPSHTYPGYGTYTVTLYVDGQNGCSDTAVRVVTINPPPAPGLSYTATCEGVPVQFAGSLSGNTQNATWLWNFGGANTSTLQSPMYTFPSWGSFPVSLSVTNSFGCSTTITQNVSVQPNPVVSITSNSVCLGSATSFSNTSAMPGGTIVSWAWDFNGDGTVDNNSSAPTYTYSTAGNYTASLVATSAAGCVASGTTPVTVYALPVSIFTAQNACLSTSTNFNNSSAAPVGSYITQYYWQFGDGTFSTVQQPTHTYAAASTYNARLDVTTNNSCVATYSTPVTVYPLPVASFVANQLCANQTTQFAGALSTGATGAQWNWNFGGGSTSSVQNPSHAFGAYGNYPVTLTATDFNGCVATTNQTVAIEPIPNISVSPSLVCTGNTTAFTNNSSIPSGSINSWSWDFNSDGITDNTTQNPLWTFPGSGNYSVSVSASSNFGCVSSAVVPVTVYALPTASFTAANNCLHAGSLFTNNSTAPAGSYLSQYAWNYGNGVNSTNSAGSCTYANPGTYQVSLAVTTNQGCTANFSAPITVYPLPLVNFSANSVCANQNTQFNNQSSIISGSINTYSWDFNNDGVGDGALQNPVYTYTNGGTYNVELSAISNFGCKDSVTKPITVYYNPVANFNASSVCLGSVAQFHDLSTSQSGNITVWDWDFTSDNVIDNLNQNPTNTYPAAGQFLVTLQVQTNFGCVNVIKKPLRVNPTPVVEFNISHQSGCEGEMCVGMMNNSAIVGGSVASWHWNFGDGMTSSQNSPVHCYHAGTFTVSLIAVSDSGCSAQAVASAPIVVYPKPQAGFDFTNTNLDVLDANTGVVSTAVGATGYVYFISDGTVINGQANFQHEFSNEQPQGYTVVQIVTSAHGCKDTIIKTIDVRPGFTFYIPNAFSPNGDGTNDIFKGTGIGIKDFSLMIYDRWGNLVFISNDLEKGWDGTFSNGDNVLLQDVFVWKVNLRDDNNKSHDYAGTVSLIK
jgi:gliding motility-associated-like protein